MTQTRSTLPEYFEKGLDNVFSIGVNQYEGEYKQLAKVTTSSKASENYNNVHGFGLISEKPENVQAESDVLKVGHRRTIVNKTYSLTTSVSQEAVDDELYGVIKDIPLGLSESLNHTLEVHAASAYNNAFDAAFADVDGQPLISATHTFAPGGATYSNTLGVDADCSFTSFDALSVQIANAQDINGKRRVLKKSKLIVSPTFERVAKEIMDSSLKPGTNNNDINVFNSNKTDIVVSHYLTTPDYWFIVCSEGMRDTAPIVCQKREGQRMRRWYDEHAQAEKFGITFRNAVGITDPSLIYGSR